MNKSDRIFLASRASRLRWLVLVLIVGSAFGIDHLLRRDISGKVSDAWMIACDESRSTVACLDRVATHHDRCFDAAYESMMLTFGRQRWESFKLMEYEACMNRDHEPAMKEVGI